MTVHWVVVWRIPCEGATWLCRSGGTWTWEDRRELADKFDSRHSAWACAKAVTTDAALSEAHISLIRVTRRKHECSKATQELTATYLGLVEQAVKLAREATREQAAKLMEEFDQNGNAKAAAYFGARIRAMPLGGGK